MSCIPECCEHVIELENEMHAAEMEVIRITKELLKLKEDYECLELSNK